MTCERSPPHGRSRPWSNTQNGRVTAEQVLDLRIDSLVRDGVQVLHDLAWTVRRGEHWAMVGPNGSGKTTLLRVLAGYLWPTRGSVEVLGKRFGQTDVRDLRKQIGVVSSALVGWLPADLTARTMVATGFEGSIGLPWVSISATQRAAAEAALVAMGAAGIADRVYGVLSQGEQQRVMIARSIVHRPALLVLDEPCGGLDPVARERFLRDLANLATAQGAPAVVFVTQHLDEIPPFVTHALALRAGAREAAGPVGEVFVAPVMSRVFGVPCTVERRGERWAFTPDVR